MNIMRKLRSGGTGAPSASSTDISESPTTPGSSHTQLGLMHLKKLFSEYTHPSHPLNEQERDDKLYNMLPLFCKVFGTSPTGDMNEKFWDILAFCHQVSLLMVSEIRKRASNQSTEMASCAIAKFLEIENCEESSNGWMLLSTLNLLAAGDVTLVQVMTEVSVPSTLVKCLYLFFDLPEMSDIEANKKDSNSDFTPRERRILLQKIFVQLLIRLCSHRIPAEELARKDDLTLLFSAITSWCSLHNVMWRKSAAEILMTLSRHGLTPPVVGYIHSKGCISLCIENMKRVPELAPLELVEMFVTLFCFLKDSSEVSSTLIDDFRQAHGYSFLSDFLIKLENEKSAEAVESVRNLVLMLTSLCMCGYIELKPSQASTGSLFQIQGFVLPQPSGKGTSVRNIQAFYVLQTIFLKSNSALLCSTILDAISNIYHTDNANYFILENQNTLSQFIEKIHLKPYEIQVKLFQLVEFLVFQLNFVPCKELISMSIFLKSYSLNYVECSLLCMKTLINILKYNVIFKDVYREVGMLEVFVTCLIRYSKLLEQNNTIKEFQFPINQEKLGNLTIDALTLLLSGNSANAAVLRECGGSKCVHQLVQYQECRSAALGIIKELILTTGGDDDMIQLLSTLHSGSGTLYELKIDILEALRLCLKESHRTRTVFRKVNGFIIVTSVLVCLEEKFQIKITNPILLNLLYLVFQTICTAMRFEPANAKLFYHEICKTSFCDTIRLLGCFASKKIIQINEISLESNFYNQSQNIFHKLFTGSIINPELPEGVNPSLCYVTLIYRLLYDLALDLFDKPISNSGVLSMRSPSLSRQASCESHCNNTSGKRSNVNSLNLNPPIPDPIIVHPGVVVSMLELLPCIIDENVEMCKSLQFYLSEVIKSLVRSERNQQVMCDKEFVGYLLSIGSAPIQDENHQLHGSLQYMLERLAAQALEPIDLRNFLRLGNPLCCLPLESKQSGGGPIPLTRIKTLVSMTTPKDFRAQSSYTSPPFVEFDMTAEGFGCLYLPSIAPQSPNAPSVVSTIDSSVLGGIGSGDRLFPPQTGLSYSTWICVDKFSDPRTDPHCVRLLTLVRTFNGVREDHLVCLSVVLSARDKAIIVSTQETHIPNHIGDWEPEGSGEHGARVWCPDILQEGQWHHVVVVLNRAVLKNSTFALYLDGQQIHTQKMHYISQCPGGGSANLTITSSVYAYIGTPPAWRRYSRLCWKQGPCHLLEEVLTPAIITQMFHLGPHYMGSFLAPNLRITESVSLVTEEKVIFGLNAKAVSQLTLNRIRKVYSRSDNKSIAKQLGMSSHESATPIRILHNSAGHLAGSARTLGGVVIGYLGVRVFCPRPVATTIDTVGGCSVLLGLIAMAQDVESLYAGVKALVCVVRSNKVAQAEMDRKRGYQTLAMLLRRKRTLLNSHILHLAFSLVGTVDSGRESSAIPNKTAFQDLLCDLDVWHEAPGELLRSHLEHLYELAAESSEKRNNTWIMRDLQLVEKLLHITPDIKHSATKQVLFSLLVTLLNGQPRQHDVLVFGQFIVFTLPTSSNINEKQINLREADHDREGEGEHILLRNKCLSVIHSMLFASRNLLTVCEDIVRILGFDWVLLFMQPNLHSTTVIWALRILIVLCANPTMMNRFREGTHNGGWLRYIEQVTHNKMAVVLGYQLNNSQANELKSESIQITGFQYLIWSLPNHLEISEIYFLLVALIMGQPVKLICAETQFDLDSVWTFLWGTSVTNQPVSTIAPRVNLCPEGVVVLLTMARSMLYNCDNIILDWCQDHPIAIIQLLFQLYHNIPEFMPIFMSSEVLNALTRVLFPIKINESGDSSGCSTPTGGDETDNIIIIEKSPLEDDLLTNHPVRQFIIDFIRVIVVDSLSLSMSGKSSSVIDLVLDAYPEKSSSSQQICYQTEILVTLMEHLLAADMLVGDQAAIPVVPLPNANIQYVTPNVFYLTARIVDKLWQGSLTKDPHEVFDFIIKLIGQSKRRSGNVSIEGLYHCLNRSILYLLSRTTNTIADQMSVLEALHKLTTNRLIVFGAGNHELDFIGCLTYCLLQLTSDMKIMLESNIKTTWHVNPNSNLELRDEQLNAHQGRNLMAGAALRVWEELYVCKKPAIEEVFKVTLILPNYNAKAPDLLIVRDQIFEAASKLWLNYVDAERKATYRVPWELHNQIQSKIHKVTGGLTRLASRTKVRKDDSIRVKVRLNKKQAYTWIQNHINLVRELVEMRHHHHQNTTQHTQRYVYQEWLQTENELTRERGLWGPPEPCYLDKWMLDMTEGPHRMRKKTMRNDLFYLHYPYRADYEKGLLKYKIATSHHSKIYYQALQMRQQNGVSGLVEPERSDSLVEEPSPLPITPLPPLARLKSDPEDQQEENEAEEEQQPPPDNQTLLRLLEDNEKISYMFRCARIQGLDTTEGLLLFGNEYCYVVDGFTLMKNREIRDIESVPNNTNEYEPILPNPGSPRRSRAMRQCSRFSYDDIREVHKRRYLLQPMALEVFSGDGRNYLLAFPRKVRNKVYQRFMSTATGIADSAQQSVAGQKRTANVEQATSLLSNLIGETSVTQRWVRGEISNFQYLMYLNTLAGRSYNDLMQYPVFPWILADYDSEELDLTNPTTFRDFTKSMGAQSSERLEQFKKRFKEWDDPHGETPPYHYGTHYSSAMIVCSYLVRIEPFTQHFLRLQGGHFDLADRMFHSVKEAWLSASKHNMADVKELIPEFFYLPEFLDNLNQFDLGVKQNGIMLGDVVLPPWAKQDPREFIRYHRMALESDFVSQNLHHWIDLIFGYKQQGQAAVDAVNVFHHLFYEGNVDIYNIDDPLKKNATIGFINNFGQIPKQLFKKPHPCKKMGNNNNNNRVSVIDTGALVQAFTLPQTEKLFFHHLDNLRPSLQPIKEVKSPVGQILHIEKSVLAVEQNKVLIPPLYNKYVAWGFADHSLRIGNYESDKAVFVSESVVHNNGEILSCVCPSSKLIVTAGTSSVVTVWEYEYRKKLLNIKHNLYAHTDAVTCLATSPAYNVIVSGSRDCTAIIWDLSRGIFVRQLRGHAGPVAAVAVNDLTGDIATCAATWLHVWTINGVQLANVNTCVGRADRMQQILCVAFSQTHEWDPLNVIMTGSTDGVTRMWSIDYVQVPIEETNKDDTLKKQLNEETYKLNIQNRLVKQINISNESGGSLMKSGSESSLCEDFHNRRNSLDRQQTSSESSCKEWKNEQQNEKETCSDTDEQIPPVPARRRKSRIHVSYRKSEGGRSSTDSSSLDVDDGSNMRTSKSDTSLTDSFVVVSEKKHITNPLNMLRLGFKWQRQLVFRSKLTMHTAYDRKDNAEPASVTALAVSRDHRAVYVGDTRGRVFSWSVCDVPGRAADHWLKDEGADFCASCSIRFTIYERKHHCRNCGQVFCSKCSRFESEISRLRILKPVRVCQNCYASLKSENK